MKKFVYIIIYIECTWTNLYCKFIIDSSVEFFKNIFRNSFVSLFIYKQNLIIIINTGIFLNLKLIV